MKRFATLFVALGFAAAGSTALAEEAQNQLSKQDANPQPMQMTDAQLDSVVAGQVEVTIVPGGLVNVSDIEVDARILNNALNDVTVQVPVAANVGAAVAVLGNARTIAGQLGRQF